MISLPDLPYAEDALAPTLSAATLRTHHREHHAGYVEKTNDLAADAGLQGRSLEEIVRAAVDEGDPGLFNNAAQAWNHGFFWRCMSPPPSAPDDDLAAAVRRRYGSLEALGRDFVEEGASHFASGWVWLVARDGALEVISTHDADTALIRPGSTPLLVCDLWEHAYYLDYQQDRKGFLTAWFDRLANWRFASAQFAAARGAAEAWTYPDGAAGSHRFEDRPGAPGGAAHP